MKKVLYVLSLAAILATATPSVMAEPPHGGHGGGMGEPHGGGRMEVPRGGGHHGHGASPNYHRHNGGAIAVGLGARRGYWAYPHSCHRLAYYYDDFYYPPYCDGYGYYSHPNWGVGLYFGF